ncbi:hypothetical protein KSP39_PZI006175 [Platanthera zijinensis]|uniref:Uncharacterized protein n=1 Tax=Platanthera zijinensis TaxID=2320716 RepID=A0AAP0GAS0_9ASPA
MQPECLWECHKEYLIQLLECWRTNFHNNFLAVLLLIQFPSGITSIELFQGGCYYQEWWELSSPTSTYSSFAAGLLRADCGTRRHTKRRVQRNRVPDSGSLQPNVSTTCIAMGADEEFLKVFRWFPNSNFVFK